jgi:hypothetical protein
MNQLLRYQQMLRWVQSYPHFGTLEEGISTTASRCDRGAYAYFIVLHTSGYEIYRGYWQRDEFVSQRDFSLSFGELYDTRRRAAMELGEERLQELQLNH